MSIKQNEHSVSRVFMCLTLPERQTFSALTHYDLKLLSDFTDIFKVD